MTFKAATALRSSAVLPWIAPSWRLHCRNGTRLIQHSLATSSTSPLSRQNHEAFPAISVPRQPDRPSAKLTRDEKRRVVDLRYLNKSYIPSDVRRLVARTMKHGENSVVDVVPILTAMFQPAGRSFVQFDNTLNALRFMHDLNHSKRQSPLDQQIVANLIDPAQPPYLRMILDRTPLALTPHNLTIYTAPSDDPGEPGEARLNLRKTLEYSGRTVLLRNIRKNAPAMLIIEALRRDDFYPERAPGILPTMPPGKGHVKMPPVRMDDVVEVAMEHLRFETSWKSLLVRLPSIAEAHRLVRQWHATYPEWAGLNGDWFIQAEVVW